MTSSLNTSSHEDLTTNDLQSDTSPYPELEDIEITQTGVRKMLEKIQVHKASGPDEIGPQVPRNIPSIIDDNLREIIRGWWYVVSLTIGEWQMQSWHTRRATAYPATTCPFPSHVLHARWWSTSQLVASWNMPTDTTSCTNFNTASGTEDPVRLSYGISKPTSSRHERWNADGCPHNGFL